MKKSNQSKVAQDCSVSALDNLDVAILNAMLSGEWKGRHIASTIGVSPAAVHYRISKLKRMGVLKGLCPSLDWRLLGYDITAVILVSARPGKVHSAMQRWVGHTNVCSIFGVTGAYDFIVIARFRSIPELNRFVKGLLADSKILNTNTCLVLDPLKEDVNVQSITEHCGKLHRGGCSALCVLTV
jgi:DNA-binding Lrp family transcriptional regulator